MGFIELQAKKYFSLVLLLGGLLGLLLPSLGLFLQVLIIPSLFVLMFFTALKVDFHRLGASLKKPKLLLFATFLSYIFIPAVLVFFSAFLGFTEEQKLAVLFSALAPTILSAPYFVSIMKGDVEFSFVLSVILTFLAPFFIPLEIYLFFAKSVELPLLEIFRSIFILVFIPISAVYILKKSVPKVIKKIEEVESSATALMFFIFTWAIIASNAEDIKALSSFMVLVLFIAFVQEFVFFFLLRFLTKLFMSDALSKSFAFSIAIKNTVLTAGIAMYYSSDLAIVSSIVVLMHVPMFAYIMYKREKI